MGGGENLVVSVFCYNFVVGNQKTTFNYEKNLNYGNDSDEHHARVLQRNTRSDQRVSVRTKRGYVYPHPNEDRRDL